MYVLPFWKFFENGINRDLRTSALANSKNEFGTDNFNRWNVFWQTFPMIRGDMFVVLGFASLI